MSLSGVYSDDFAIISYDDVKNFIIQISLCNHEFILHLNSPSDLYQYDIKFHLLFGLYISLIG